jgi:rhodanese-related sulfurtransferase
MKKEFFFLFLLSAIISCSNQAQDVMTPDQFELKIKDKDALVLDVRTTKEYNTGYIKNAFQADWTNKEQFADRTQYLDKSKTVYIYCQSGGRSAAAAEAFREKGFKVINLEGGMTAWKKAGKPVEGLREENKMSNDQYIDLTGSAKLVMIDFGAAWCLPCKKMEPVVEEIKKTMLDKVSVKFVDGGVNTDLMNTWNVEALPTFIIYKQGKEVWRKKGIVSSEEFTSVINSFQ